MDPVSSNATGARCPISIALSPRRRFRRLGTTIPPQSPVAWSDLHHRDGPGRPRHLRLHSPRPEDHGAVPVHVARNPRRRPSSSASTRSRSERQIELLRHGQPFWEVLEERGIQTTIVRMPANFPPSGTASHELSGMGTPDLLGTYGTFSFYTTDPFTWAGKDVGGGKVYTSELRGASSRGRSTGRRTPSSSSRPRPRPTSRCTWTRTSPWPTRGGRGGAGPQGGRVVGLGARGPPSGPHPDDPGHGALLPEVRPRTSGSTSRRSISTP